MIINIASPVLTIQGLKKILQEKRNFQNCIFLTDEYYLKDLSQLIPEKNKGLLISYPFGAETITTKSALISKAVNQGCSHIFYTPDHNRLLSGDILYFREELKNIIQETSGQIEIALLLLLKELPFRILEKTLHLIKESSKAAVYSYAAIQDDVIDAGFLEYLKTRYPEIPGIHPFQTEGVLL